MESSAAHGFLGRIGALMVVLLLAANAESAETTASGRRFRLCVAVDHFAVCRRLTAGSGLALDCVAGNDRLDCLRKVQARDADFLAVDPEDVYVALQMDNADFGVFAEVRTLEEPAAEFRYEGIVLVRRADGFTSMGDLRGKKSCHTGYGRNVGYKIPITKLRRLGVFKLPATDERHHHQSPVEHELAGLSELFRSSCLTGRYSPDADIDRVLKKRYANLCALCADPDKCSATDRYAGYEGAIRCLVENGGDVAFTKTNFVRRYFGLPLSPGGLAKPPVNPTVRPNDYVYLCENGTTRPVTDQQTVCSWAQRPWPALMGNGDLTGEGRMAELQAVLQAFYRHYTRDSAVTEVSPADREAAHLLGLDRRHLIVDQRLLLPPAEYLTRAYYTDVIERETPYDFRIRLCVVSEPERQKCVQLQRAAFARDVRPAFQCVLKTAEACAEAVATGDVDAVVLKEPPASPAALLKPVVWEVFDDVMWAIADKGLSPDQLRLGPVAYDPADKRAVAAAEALRAKRPSLRLVPESANGTSAAPIRIVSSRTLARHDAERHSLLCRDHRLEPLSATGCHLDDDDGGGGGDRRERPAARVYIRRGANETTQDSIVHAFTALSDAFGRGKRHERVFQLFGPFRLLTPPDRQVSDLIFHDYATALAAPSDPDA